MRNKWDLVETWLDIKNAYGSIPHKLINLALEKTHLPEDVISIVKNYYEDVQIRFTTPNFTTKWQKLERGIAMHFKCTPVCPNNDNAPPVNKKRN